ncbi:single-stranded DNA-binding protein [Microbispora sp. NBRC 16548]|uniref:single-stranded DNA-binding protein n=1 Tax=Microbispora sp. NBRC 16548 TaxID=3030994 RepID=UPI0024A55982|nr:single-stranded DNA-binding protein [Microbispora sp. NBRC 16548]GLX06733.1 single-stranded DNA-binding protein 2 [Microbispora sp. NBRC 16548]
MLLTNEMTIAGNLVDDPELRFTPTGVPVARFRIASTPRFLDRQTNEWKDGEGLFLTCNVWRQAAENLAESLQRGSRVIVHGRLRQRSYETKEGDKRTVYELDVIEVGASLAFATARLEKNAPRSGGGPDFWREASPTQPAPAAEPTPAEPAPPTAAEPDGASVPGTGPAADPWRTDFSDEPPF